MLFRSFAVIVFAFLFVDLFDTVGTLIGVAPVSYTHLGRYQQVFTARTFRMPCSGRMDIFLCPNTSTSESPPIRPPYIIIINIIFEIAEIWFVMPFDTPTAVSYTHLDVYKRQPLAFVLYIVPTCERSPLPRSSRPAPIGRPPSEKAVWLLP